VRVHLHHPDGAYRGAGRLEANYHEERLVETAAAELGIGRRTAPNLLNEALKLADCDSFAVRRTESRSRGGD
jgi:hypothetical protein